MPRIAPTNWKVQMDVFQLRLKGFSPFLREEIYDRF
jgi:hypothetical protein